MAERRRILVEQLARQMGASPGEVRAQLDELAVEPPAPPPEPAGPPELVVPGEPEVTGDPDDLVLPGDPEPDEAPGTAEIVLPPALEAAPPEAPPELVLPDEPEDRHEPELIMPDDPGPRPQVAGPALVVPASAEVEREEARGQAARRSPIPVVLGLAVGLLLVAMIFIGALSGGGGDGGEERAAATPASTPARTPSPSPTSTPASTPSPSATATASPPPPLTAVAGGAAKGTITVQGRELRLEVEGLDRPTRDYEVWLFNDLADARSLGRLDRQPLRLPRSSERYRSLDVSLEPGENPNHSGRSVLRADRPR